ncbi:flagellum-specific peptidoglycan hydrolase FlgJ [Neolewinella xylanilytica]|uniref:Flagellum-specific peptidoglycan hydrolase FlgJ n=1 Tax=Neolewinella xylanilytica TaxID=1514080 RepID=A0A2S6I454_9BACT|nr:glucosaminidase domain-containing protein [Neolewinella xylanilytica]PPK85940.1 flagellum-specific peptidoglycan hydrolase FlgJ [Neolewinella xylanilytica]
MPAPPTSTFTSDLGRRMARFVDYLVHYAVEAALVALILYVCISRGLSVEVDVHDPRFPAPHAAGIAEAGIGGWFTVAVNRLSRGITGSRVTDRIYAVADAPGTTDAPDEFSSVARTDDPAPHIPNLTLVLSPDYGERKGLAPEIVRGKKQRVTNYIERHAAAARREMRAYGIPASITLAQALLESNAGDSKLAVNSNNHFGIKCRTKCLGCTCRNYGDDTRYDMFRVFDSVADSFREHSILLNTSRYAKLKQYGNDYVKWAHGLKACGYATDPKYGHKLVTIIENLGLDRYDRSGV